MFDLVVIGGGAAGLFAAGTAYKRGKRVLLIEHQEKVGKKILISGGGRCNFTNREASAKNYLSANPHFTRSALCAYPPGDFIALVEKHGIAYHEKTQGQLFCDDSARQIVTMLLAEAAGIRIDTGCRIEEVRHDGVFRLRTSRQVLQCKSLIVASGGLSIPKLGASDIGYRIATQFQHKIEPTAAALVPFVLTPAERERNALLQGVAAPTAVSLAKTRFEEASLFTHHGLSGPAILQISSYWKPGESIRIDWSPGLPLFPWLKERKQRGDKTQLHNLLGEVMPKRLAAHFAEAIPLQEQSDEKLRQQAERIHGHLVTPLHTAGYDKAEVTRGGVSTDGLAQKTLESKTVPGLFFVGEVVDVTGWLGGYNFQWAWSSGFAAGSAC